MNHEIVVFENGQASMRDLRSGEAMHSSIGPWKEANEIYVGQSALAKRMGSGSRRNAVVLLDLGMGIAANALAAIETARSMPERRALEIWSLERDIKPLQSARSATGTFDFIGRNQDAVAQLLEKRHWAEPGISWHLIEGEYEECPLPPAEIVFYDFYSPKANPDAWTFTAFKRLRAAAAEDMIASTYCASTAARAAMMLAGFFVGRGRATEQKSETTVFTVRRDDLSDPLAPSWLEKLRRSSQPLPSDWPKDGLDDAICACERKLRPIG